MSISNEILHRLSDIKIENGNEAEIRFSVIDEILLSILNWDKADVKTEHRVSEDGVDGFVDYLITTAQTSILIEAKRIQVNFSSLPNTRRAALKGTWMRGDIRKAVHQARDYGRKIGVGFCAVTNGDSWVIFPVNRRDLVSFEETHALIFQNARAALEFDLSEFKSIMSRDSVIDGSLEKVLLGGENNQTESRRLNSIYDHSFSKLNRTSMFSSIESEIVTAFSEELVSDNPELLEKAYVETSDRMKFDDRVQMAVLRKDQDFVTRPMRPLGRTGLDATAEHVLNTRVKAQPVALLTLGLVGAGKTTFLRYVERVSGREFFEVNEISQKAHWLYIDFRNFSKSQPPRDFIYGQIFEYIRNNPILGDYDITIKNAYEIEINALKRGPLSMMAADEALFNAQLVEILLQDYKEKIPYCEHILKYSSKNIPIFLVIDNVDQIEDVSVQENIFLDSISIARNCYLNLVLAMRDTTYVKNKSSAVFDAFAVDAIYIDHPIIQSVLSKRFAIAEHLLKNKTFEFTTDNGAKVEVSDASRIVKMLGASVLGTEVGNLIEVCSTGDVRLALLMTKQFLQAGYSSSHRAYVQFENNNKFNFPVHEAVRAIMFGNQSIYRDEFSPIINPFDSKSGRSETQFLRVYVMNALILSASTNSFEGLEVRDIIGPLEKMGFSSRITNKIINDLISARCCFPKSHREFNIDSVLVPTRLCGYVIRDLLSKLIFYECVIFDTFIYDDNTWNKVKSSMKRVYRERNTVRKLKIRNEIATNFYNWCEVEIGKLCAEAVKRNLGPIWTSNPLTRLRVDFENELERAFKSAERNYGTDLDQELTEI